MIDHVATRNRDPATALETGTNEQTNKRIPERRVEGVTTEHPISGVDPGSRTR